MNGFVFLAASGLGFASAEMGLTAVVAARVRNSGIVDAVWALGFAVLALIYATIGNGLPERRWMLAILVGIWSLRLGIHLLLRILRHHPAEDVRYAELRREWGGSMRWKMPVFFLLQGVLQVLLSLPFAVICQNAVPGGGWLHLTSIEWAGVVVWCVATAGEAVADLQLKRFRDSTTSSAAVCQSGLWRYSRHPNYFFEWLIWVSYFLLACAAPLGWIGVLAPVLMLYFLLRVTGIPMTEALSIRSKGDAYRHYQRTTSAFIPWFPRTVATAPVKPGLGNS